MQNNHHHCINRLSSTQHKKDVLDCVRQLPQIVRETGSIDCVQLLLEGLAGGVQVGAPSRRGGGLRGTRLIHTGGPLSYQM